MGNKIALITDTHHGIRNDSNIFLENQEKFYDNIFFPKLREEGITTIIHLGDYFDRRKYINFKTLWESNRFFIKKLEEYGIKMHVIAGNHDVAYKNTNKINSLDLALRDLPFVHVYTHEIGVLDFGKNCKIKLVPWICSENHDEFTDNMRNNPEEANILCGHLEIAGFEMYKGSVSEDGMNVSCLSPYEQVFSGHYHHKSFKGNIMYLGSSFEFTWSDYNDDRGFHILDTDSLELEYIRNPYQMFHKVIFDKNSDPGMNLDIIKDAFVKVVIKEVNDPYKLDRYLDNVYSHKPYDVQIVDMREEEIGNMTDEEIQEKAKDTKQLITEYVDTIDEINESAKKELHDLMSNLYKQSISEEVDIDDNI
tara:strand:+ start:1315 stop:2409 length:1095 start_codon:yes stop_codon:yes gene_type:complete